MIINGSIIIECFDQGDNKIYEITKKSSSKLILIGNG